MKNNQSTNVFVSYSHADASLVAPVVQLLRANKSFVFQDLDTIRPGKKWREEISNAIDKSHLVVVFWCNHSSRSDEVSKEWKAAIEQKKDLLPLLLDATPLHPKLGEYQWIDFRKTVGENHSTIGKKVEDRAGASPRKSVRWWFVGGLTSVLLAATVTFYMTQQTPVLTETSTQIETEQRLRPQAEAQLQRHEEEMARLEAEKARIEAEVERLEAQRRYEEEREQIDPEVERLEAQRRYEEERARLEAEMVRLEEERAWHEAERQLKARGIDTVFRARREAEEKARQEAQSKNLLTLLSIIVVVAAGLYWLWRRRSKRVNTKELEARIKVVRTHPSEIDQRIATELETEILRRTASRNDGVA